MSCLCSDFLQNVKDGNRNHVETELRKDPCLVTSIEESTLYNPFHIAAINNYSSFVSLFLRTNHFMLPSLVNGADAEGKTPLHYACELGSHIFCEELIKSSFVKYDVEDLGYRTPLRNAVVGKHEAVVKVLMKDSKLIPLVMSEGRTPVYRGTESAQTIKLQCIEKNDIFLLQWLVEDDRLLEKEAFSAHDLWLACQHSDLRIAKYIVDSCTEADLLPDSLVGKDATNGQTALLQLIKSVDRSQINIQGPTPLWLRLCQRIIESGWDFFSQTESPADCVVSQAIFLGDYKLCEFLVTKLKRIELGEQLIIPRAQSINNYDRALIDNPAEIHPSEQQFPRRHSRHRQSSQNRGPTNLLPSLKLTTSGLSYASKLQWYQRSRIILSPMEQDRHRLMIVALMLSLVLPVDKHGKYRIDAQVDQAKLVWIELLQTLPNSQTLVLGHLLNINGLGFCNASKVLCDSNDQQISLAIARAAIEVRLELWQHCLFCGRYEIESGPPIHQSSTSIVCFAKDFYLFENFQTVFELYKINDNSGVCYLDRDGFIDCLCDLNYELRDMTELSETEMEVAFVQCNMNGKVDRETFLQFCRWKIGEHRRIAIKFMKKQVQYDHEIDLRLQLLSDAPLRSTRINQHSRSSTLRSAKEGELGISKRDLQQSSSKDVEHCTEDYQDLREHCVPVLEDFPMKPKEHAEHSRILRLGKRAIQVIKEEKLERVKYSIKFARVDGIRPALMQEYNKAIAMPVVSKTLAEIISAAFDINQGNDGRGFAVPQIKSMARDIALCMAHFHGKGIIHGDIKPQNIALIRKQLVLFDLDTAGCEYAGFKYSSAYLPPEMFCCLDEEPRSSKLFPYSDVSRKERFYFSSKLKKYFGVKAYDFKFRASLVRIRFKEELEKFYELIPLTATFDIWAFGMILFSLFTGRNTYFDVNKDSQGNLPPEKYQNAFELNDPNSVISKSLAKDIGALVSDLDAQDLLRKIFLADPQLRLQSAKDLLMHPFLSENNERTLSKKQIGIMSKFKSNILQAIRSKRPIHVALIRREAISTETLMQHIHTAQHLDHKGRSALDIALSQLSNSLLANGSVACSINHINEDILYILVTDSLTLNDCDAVTFDGTRQQLAWLKLLRCCHSIAISVVSRILQFHRKWLHLLSNCVDEHGVNIDCRYSHTLCESSRDAIKSATFIYGIYDIGPEYRMINDSVVFHGSDHSIPDVDPVPITLRFVYERQHFVNEVKLRENVDINKGYVVPIIRTYCIDETINSMPSSSDVAFFISANAYLEARNKPPCKCCIIMERTESTLDRKLEGEVIAGSNGDMNVIYSIAKSLCNSIVYLHSKAVSIVHASIEPREILISPDHSARLISLANSSTCDCASKTNLSYADDLWQFGVVLYLLLTGTSLLSNGHDVDNNTVGTPDFRRDRMDVMRLTDLISNSKVKHEGYRHLLQLLLLSVDAERPTAAQVGSYLSYPRSLVDAPPEFDVFISYRVATDFDISQLVYKVLTRRGVRVWWDQRCIAAGTQWEEEFCAGLANSCYCICIVSGPATDKMKALSQDSKCDNVLLEWSLALNLLEKKLLRGVIPLIVSSIDVDQFPQTSISSVNEKLSDHFLSLPIWNASVTHSSGIKFLTVKEIVRSVLGYQGAMLPFSDKLKIDSVLAKIAQDVVHNRELIENQRNSSHYAERQHISKLEIDVEELKDENQRLREELARYKALLEHKNVKLSIDVNVERPVVEKPSLLSPRLRK